MPPTQIQLFVEKVPNDILTKFFSEFKCYRSLFKFPMRDHSFIEMRQALSNYIKRFAVLESDETDPRKNYLDTCVITRDYNKLEDLFNRKDQFIDEPLMHMLNQGRINIP